MNRKPNPILFIKQSYKFDAPEPKTITIDNIEGASSKSSNIGENPVGLRMYKVQSVDEKDKWYLITTDNKLKAGDKIRFDIVGKSQWQ